jgi:hypothetical protein
MRISGKITDINNLPLMGANITLKTGSKSGKVGTISDFDGNFSLEGEDFSDSDIFEISYIGFAKQSFSVKDLQDKKITLKESIDELDEVILVGTKPKKNNINQIENKLQEHFSKNKNAYAGGLGLLGLGLILFSIKKLN